MQELYHLLESKVAGKTTMLMAMIENIYDTMNIRVQETAFELHLRKIYPTRNILSFRETDTISGQMGLDVQKKTDGGVNIIRRGCNRPRSCIDDTSCTSCF